MRRALWIPALVAAVLEFTPDAPADLTLEVVTQAEDGWVVRQPIVVLPGR